ncbi:MAG: type II toxin-antitoxin system VapC family toxin [Saprospiraceae bacterium]|nr:type II toxin-antitoxin system VapC family toxin [Saprospiraceae bacterium]MBK8634967.1 type II toxin-antitoxin system VapC family toxin [Saprospiraceae bacterium]MBP7645010.1 type II toxin-antitoxin system VapC family toxin [Saprospiraceae bacterium]
MQYLLDSQILIWLLSDSKKVNKNLLTVLEDSANTVYYSSVSIAELYIKVSQNKLILPKLFLEHLTDLNFIELPLKCNHLIKLLSLPYHHKDPFDRFIICQGMVENLTIVSSDAVFSNYNVKLVSPL